MGRTATHFGRRTALLQPPTQLSLAVPHARAVFAVGSYTPFFPHLVPPPHPPPPSPLGARRLCVWGGVGCCYCCVPAAGAPGLRPLLTRPAYAPC